MQAPVTNQVEHPNADVKPAAIQNMQQNEGAIKRKQWNVKNEPSAPNTVTPVTKKKRVPMSAIPNSKIANGHQNGP